MVAGDAPSMVGGLVLLGSGLAFGLGLLAMALRQRPRGVRLLRMGLYGFVFYLLLEIVRRLRS